MARAASSRTKEISCRQLNCPYLRFIHNVYCTGPVPKYGTLTLLFAYTCDKVQKDHSNSSKFEFQNVSGAGFIKPATQHIPYNYLASI